MFPTKAFALAVPRTDAPAIWAVEAPQGRAPLCQSGGWVITLWRSFLMLTLLHGVAGLRIWNTFIINYKQWRWGPWQDSWTSFRAATFQLSKPCSGMLEQVRNCIFLNMFDLNFSFSVRLPSFPDFSNFTFLEPSNQHSLAWSQEYQI